MAYLHGCYLLMIIFKALPISHQACLKGWVGSECDMLCNCIGQCHWNGNCYTANMCKLNTFGPGCQYMDVLSWEFAPEVPEYVRDGNIITCNPNPNATLLEVTLKKPVTFTWVRIVVNDPAEIDNFNITFNDNEICWNERRFRVDRNTVDVSFDTETLVSALHISGSIAGNICSVHISAGRQISLKQKTWQSSTNRFGSTFYDSSKAVDNDKGSCATTIYEARGPEWSITFSIPAILITINVFNIEAYRYRLEGASMWMYTDEGQMDNLVILNATYPFVSISPHTLTPIRRILIKQSHLLQHIDIRLSICEFSAYGETICPDNMYGLHCEQKCSCNATQSCNYVTGACAQGCPPGFYGFNCTSPCSPFCEPTVCHYFSGSCFPCSYGYFGKTCEDECLPGTYGLKFPCKNCSIGCNNTCDTINGTCNCKDIYFGPRCDDCKPGTYGPELNCINCSIGCSDICDSKTGDCQCLMDFFGPRCLECEPGTFGKDCTHFCSHGCADNCDIETGVCKCRKNYVGSHCTVCRPGYFGPDCQFECAVGCANTCNNTNGRCKCKAEFGGPRCTECELMHYGAKCKSNCGKGCVDTCEKRTGRCLCRMNYLSPFCRDCKPGHFGSKCSLNCSRGCDKGCNKTNGHCTCKKNYVGQQCSECVHPRYGRRCDLTCSKLCQNQSCGRMTGKCMSCVNGVQDDNCVLASETDAAKWLSPIPFLSFLLIFLFCSTQRKNEDATED